MNNLTSQRLIETKLLPPNLTRNNVGRAAVLALITAHPQQSASVVATAGFGKTTALKQIYDLLGSQSVRLAWLSLDPQDNKPAAFLGYFCEMLTRAGVIDQRDVFQQTGLTSADGIDLAFALIHQAAARVTEPTAIFLDDFQTIRDPQLLAGISGFLDAKSDNLRVFIAARQQPDLHMQKRIMAGSFIRIDHDILKFQEEEAKTFFALSGNETAKRSDISRMVKSTEGWPAGLQIASISRQTTSTQAPSLPPDFSGASNQVVQYLSDNVFRALPEDVQDFLLATGPLNRFNASMCRHVRGRSGNAAVLEWLLDRNLFLVALDNSGTWYRYHHMFADFLSHMAQKAGRYKKQDIFRRASAWCHDNGLMDEAVDYLLEVGSYAEAAEMIAQLSPRLARQRGDTVTLIRWIESLPAKHRTGYPVMMLDYAFALSFSLETDRAHAIIAEVRENLAQSHDNNALAYADTVDALAIAARDGQRNALRLIERARQDWPNADAGTRGILSNIAAYCQITENRPDAAARDVVDARMNGLTSGLGYVSIWADCIDTMVLCRSGDMSGAHEPLDRARQNVATDGDSELLSLLVQLLSANLAYLEGDMSAAERHFPSGSGYSASFGPVEPLIIGHTTRAWCAQVSGDSQSPLEIAERGMDLGLRRGLPRLTFTMIGLKMSFLSLQGNKGAARRFAQRWGILDGSWKTRFVTDADVLDMAHSRLMAELAITEARPEDAIRVLQQMERRTRHRPGVADVIRLHVIKAHALAQAHQTDTALRNVSKAAEHAVETGVIAPFIEYRTYAIPLLVEVMRRRKQVDTPTSLLNASAEAQLLTRLLPDGDPLAPVPQQDAPIMPEQLTQREAELLRLAESGMTNAQMAVHLVLSEATVKWHLHNAFQKLGVRNRTSALLVARKHELI